MGVWVRCGNKKAVITVGGKIITVTKKNMSELLKCEGDVHLFFSVGVVHHEFVPRVQTVSKVLLGGHEVLEGGSVKEET